MAFGGDEGFRLPTFTVLCVFVLYILRINIKFDQNIKQRKR